MKQVESASSQSLAAMQGQNKALELKLIKLNEEYSKLQQTILEQ
jgi:hypothetical protein